MEEFTDIYEFAEALHDFHCKWSHMDQCSWEYDKALDNPWDREYSSHKSYLQYAKNIMEELPDYTPEQIMIVVKGMKAGMVSRYKGRY